MARFRWTENAKAEVVRRAKFGFTYAEIGAYFGVTGRAVALAVRRYRLIDPDEARARVWEKSKGRPKSESHKRKLAAAQRAKWTLDRRAEMSERLRAHRATEAGRAEVLRGLKTVARNKRGFDVPDEKRPEYVFLRRSKKIPAREAGAMIGLPHNHEARGGR